MPCLQNQGRALEFPLKLSAPLILQGRLSLEAGLAAARLEEELQIEEWGLVEGGHDIDIADLRVRVAAPSVFVRLLKAGA